MTPLLAKLRDVAKTAETATLDYSCWNAYLSVCRVFANKLPLTIYERRFATRLSDTISSHLYGKNFLIHTPPEIENLHISASQTERHILLSLMNNVTVQCNNNCDNCKAFVNLDVAHEIHKQWHLVPHRNDESIIGIMVHLAVNIPRVTPEQNEMKSSAVQVNIDTATDENNGAGQNIMDTEPSVEHLLLQIQQKLNDGLLQRDQVDFLKSLFTNDATSTCREKNIFIGVSALSFAYNLLSIRRFIRHGTEDMKSGFGHYISEKIDFQKDGFNVLTTLIKDIKTIIRILPALNKLKQLAEQSGMIDLNSSTWYFDLKQIETKAIRDKLEHYYRRLGEYLGYGGAETCTKDPLCRTAGDDHNMRLFVDEYEQITGNLRLLLNSLVTKDILLEDAVRVMNALKEQAILDGLLDIAKLLEEMIVAVNAGETIEDEVITALKLKAKEAAPRKLITPDINFDDDFSETDESGLVNEASLPMITDYEINTEEDSSSKLRALEIENADLKLKVRDVEYDMKRLQQNRDGTTARNEELQAKITEYESQLDFKNKEIESLNTQLNEIEFRLQETNNDTIRTTSEKRECQERLALTQQKYSECEKQLTRLDADLTDAHDDVDKLNEKHSAHLKCLNDKIVKRDEIIAQHENEIKRLQQKVVQVEEELVNEAKNCKKIYNDLQECKKDLSIKKHIIETRSMITGLELQTSSADKRKRSIELDTYKESTEKAKHLRGNEKQCDIPKTKVVSYSDIYQELEEAMHEAQPTQKDVEIETLSLDDIQCLSYVESDMDSEMKEKFAKAVGKLRRIVCDKAAKHASSSIYENVTSPVNLTPYMPRWGLVFEYIYNDKPVSKTDLENFFAALDAIINE